MTKREIGAILAGVLLLGGVTLWGATALIDHYAFADEASDAAPDRR